MIAVNSDTDTSRWDEALTKHILAADPAYIACLSPQCGLYFSAEGCGSKSQQSDSKTETRSKGKQKQSEVSKAICPYCNAALCLSCNRNWHPSTCNRAMKLEDAQSLQTIEKLGAEPCPKCGLNIEKNGGCDHMNCTPPLSLLLYIYLPLQAPQTTLFQTHKHH